MIPKKPERKEHTEITGAKPPNNRIFDAIGFALAERNYYKSVAERAIEALKDVVNCSMTKNPFAVAQSALQDIEESK